MARILILSTILAALSGCATIQPVDVTKFKTTQIQLSNQTLSISHRPKALDDAMPTFINKVVDVESSHQEIIKLFSQYYFYEDAMRNPHGLFNVAVFAYQWQGQLSEQATLFQQLGQHIQSKGADNVSIIELNGQQWFQFDYDGPYPMVYLATPINNKYYIYLSFSFIDHDDAANQAWYDDAKSVYQTMKQSITLGNLKTL